MTKEKEPEARQKLKTIGFDVMIKKPGRGLGLFQERRTGAG
jgi:hypothetical protein